jgi:hypothetical protein
MDQAPPPWDAHKYQQLRDNKYLYIENIYLLYLHCAVTSPVSWDVRKQRMSYLVAMHELEAPSSDCLSWH